MSKDQAPPVQDTSWVGSWEFIQGVCIGSHLRAPALKTENFSKKLGRFSVKRENGLEVKLASPYFSRVFCPGDGFSKSVFAFY